MTRISFHQKLESLRERLLQMAGVAEQTLSLALDAHCRGQLSACASVRLNEAIINRSEREIDQMALDILAMEQPMAVDLRFVLAAIKINSDLERVGDQSMTIALLAEELAGSQPCDFPIDIPRMADDAVDEMNRRAKAVLLDCIAQDSSAARSAVNLLFISRSLERIADHATNMAEDVIFWLSGADVRHGYILHAQN
jgi:phosphate transport system protein